jgi:protein-histidine pros-kinase
MSVVTVFAPATTPDHPVLEALADGICVLGSDGLVTYWNAAAERLLDAPRELVLGRRLSDAFPHVDEAALQELLAPVRSTGRPLRLAGVSLFPSPTRPFTAIATTVQEGIALQLRPVDERVERPAGLLESIRHGCVAVDGAGRIEYINRAGRGMLGVRRAFAVGASLWSLLPAEPAELRATLAATTRDGLPRRLTAIRVEGGSPDGRFFDVWTHPLDGGGFSILFEDVTQRVARDRELARFAAEAEEASRAKDRFFAAASHELRTPLHAIVGYTHLLATATFGPMPREAERAAERSHVCAEHLAQLIDDVLLLATTEIDRLPVVPVSVPPAAYLGATMEPLRLQAEGKGLSFTLAAPADLPAVETDPERLRQVLQSLVGNAIKFTGAGEVRVEASAPGGSVLEIRVSDTGPGIPADERLRIFEPFEQIGDPSRTDSLNRGAGLGLTIARQLVDRLHGSLAVEARDGGGAVFRLRLPLAFQRPHA